MALRRKLAPKAEYYGVYPRLLFMDLVDRIVKRPTLENT
jgi:hypothetical protein